MKLKFFRCLIWVAVLVLVGGQAAFADTVTESFDTASGTVMPDGWATYGSSSTYKADKETYHSAKISIAVDVVNNSAYLITPMLQGDFNFWIRNYTKSYQASVTAYACTYDGEEMNLGNQLGSQTLSKTSSGTPAWTKVSFNSPTATRVALLISRAYFDDFTYTPGVETAGASLLVKDFANGDEYDFGTVPAGTQHTFNLINQGTEELKIKSLTATGGFVIVSGSELTTIAPGENADVTVETPANDAEGTLTIESNDENSPYEIILKSTYKVPAPVMEVSPLALNFGKVTADASDNILIKNSGDGQLTVTATCDNADFVLSENSFIVEPGQETTLTVTFKYSADKVGANKAVVMLKPNQGETVSIEATATVKDPNIWEEDFEDGIMPQGWSTTGWTVEIANSYYGNGTYMAYAGATSNDYTLTTPRLYATEGQELKFEVGKTTDQYDALTVEFSHDLESWTNIEGSPITSSGEKIFTAPESGYYYLRFKGKYGRVDNFVGFKLALKEHDLSVAGQQIPTQGNQYEEYVATISVKEMMGKAETATAELFINGKMMATATEEIGENETVKISLSFVPEEGVEDAEAYIVVTYAEAETIKSDVVNITIAPAPIWDEAGEADFEDGILPVVVFKYTPAMGWNTISVPFALNDEYLTQIFGESYNVYELKGYENGVIKFQEALLNDGKYAAGYPYVVYASASDEEDSDPEEETIEAKSNSSAIILKNVKVERPTPQSEESNGVKFSAVFSKQEAAEEETFYEIDSTSHTLKDVASLTGYRGYITLSPTITKVPEVKFYDGSGEETGVEAIEMEMFTAEGIYNLQGVKVKQPVAPGIYIVNGKKMVIK